MDDVIYNRLYVYRACLLAETRGVDCGAFGNACGASNKGEYENTFFQGIASQYGEEADQSSEEELYGQYHIYKYGK